MKRIICILILACFALVPSPSRAAERELIGSFNDWKAYHFLFNGEKVCFIEAAPEKEEGNFKKRGDVAFFITRWSSEKKHVVSLSNGYTFKQDTEAVIASGDKKFSLFTQGEMAWSKDQAADDAIVEFLEKGSKMTIAGVSWRDTATTDTYSLKGLTEAYKAMTGACTEKTE